MSLRLDILAPHLLRLYTWELLKANGALTTVTGRNGQTLIPIAPVSDEPDLRESGKPYILYGFAENYGPRVPVVNSGTLSYRIIAPTFSELSKIIAVLQSAFEVEDVAAANVNLWTSTQSALIGCRFTSVECAYLEAADAEEQEGGSLEGVVNMTYSCVVDKPVKLFTGNNWA